VAISGFSQEIPQAQRERIETRIGGWKRAVSRCPDGLGDKAAAAAIIAEAERFLANHEYTRCEARLQATVLSNLERALRGGGGP